MEWRRRALELLDAEGVRADDGDLLEVERRPLEAPRDLDAGDHDRAARRHDADAHLDRLREADRVVHHVDAAAVEPRHAVPRREHLARPSRRPTRVTISATGSCGTTTCAPKRSASARWCGNRATAITRLDGWSSRRMAIVRSPSVPQPYTSTGAPSAGGRFSIACSDTENGSASTASSSLTSSGIGMHIDSCAGT